MNIADAWNFVTDEENKNKNYVDKLQRLLFFGIKKEVAEMIIIFQENNIQMTVKQLEVIEEVYRC